jgi:uncharacterized membrane protein YbhN (UPF0104 family)
VRRLLSAALALLLLAALFAWFGVDEIAATLRDASPSGLLLYAGLSAAVVVAYSARWWLLTRTVGAPMSLRRCIAARLAGDAVGSVVPSAKLAGEPLRIVAVRAGGQPLAAATAGVGLDRMLELIGNTVAVIAYIAIFALWRGGGELARHPVPIVLGMLALLGALLSPVLCVRLGYPALAPLHLGRLRRVARLRPWLERLERLEAHLEHVFARRPRVFLVGVLASLATEIVIVAQYHALLAAFGIGLDLPTLLLVVLGGGLARAIPTPGGLGGLEATQTLLVGTASGRPDLGFVVGLLVRLHETLLLGLGLAALVWLGVPRRPWSWHAEAAEARR